MKIKFISLLLIFSFGALFISGCSNSHSSSYSSIGTIEDFDEDDLEDDVEDEDEEEDVDDNAEWGEMEDIDKTKDIEDIDALELWDVKNKKNFSYSFVYEGQEQSYKIIAPETGNYRFSFNIDDINKCYGYKIYSSDHTVIKGGYNDDDVTVEFKKGEKYAFKIYQQVDLPKASISVGVPKPIRTITDNVVSDTLRYIDQEDKYTFTTEVEGVYGIELISNNVQYNYTVTLFDTSNNEKLESKDSPQNGNQVFLNKKLDANKEYKIVVSVDEVPDTEFKYTLKINVPQDVQIIEYSYVEDEFTFGGQLNEYLFNIQKSGEYEVLINDSKEPMEYKVTIYDNKRDERIKEFGNHYSYISVDLDENIEYRIEVQQEDKYGEYYFEFVEKDDQK